MRKARPREGTRFARSASQLRTRELEEARESPNLLDVCPQLETLQLLGIGRSNLGSWRYELGKPLTEALYGLEKLKRFEVRNLDWVMPLGGDNLIRCAQL